MIKCINNFIWEGVETIEFKKGEYYSFEFDYENQWYDVDYDHTINVTVFEREIKENFRFCKQEIIDLSKENKEPKEYKAKIIDNKTGKVIKEGIYNSKGEFKEDKHE